MVQLDLFLPPPAVAAETSIEAAAAIEERARPLRERVYEYLLSRPVGATRQEISDGLSMKLQTVCGRIAELREEGRVWEGPLKRAGRRVVLAKGGKDVESYGSAGSRCDRGRAGNGRWDV